MASLLSPLRKKAGLFLLFSCKSSYSVFAVYLRPIPINRKLHTSADYLLGLTEYPEPPAELNHNAKEYLNYEQLHWDGVPLEKDDLDLIRNLLERVLRERTLPKGE